MIQKQISLYNISKIIFDIIFAFVLFLLLLPLLFCIFVLIFLETGSNPIFTQKRGLSLEKPLFKIYKFRTLRNNKVKIKNSSILIKEELAEQVTVSGYFLRKTGLDELPQLLNILLGEMSFIGPRPLSIEDLLLMKENDHHFYSRRNMINSKPGISGYWQVLGRRTEGIKNLIESEENYEKMKSLSFDAYLILMTIPIILLGRHYDSIFPEKRKKTTLSLNPAEKI